MIVVVVDFYIMLMIWSLAREGEDRPTVVGKELKTLQEKKVFLKERSDRATETQKHSVLLPHTFRFSLLHSVFVVVVVVVIVVFIMNP